jgi:acetyl-CoA carboxylase biotin carboxyl carrier protein
MWGRKVRVSKSANNTAPAQVSVQTPSVQVPTAHGRSDTSLQTTRDKAAETMPANTTSIKSPIVGTFYRATSPDGQPYVEIGDVVKPGQVVCIVEAMKLMNEIESDVAGKIVKILAKNEEPVEYNQDLFLVEMM